MKWIFTATAAAAMVLAACTKSATSRNEDQLTVLTPTPVQPQPVSPQQMSPATIGTVHNAAIGFIDANMNPGNQDDYNSVTQNEIAVLNNYFAGNPQYEVTPTIVSTSVNNSNSFYQSVEDRYGRFTTRQAALLLIDSSKTDILPVLRQRGVLTLKEYNFLNSLLDQVAQAENNGNQTGYGSLAQSLQSSWQAQNFDTLNREGYISQSAIQVMSNSFNYWTNYNSTSTTPIAVGGRVTAIPAWVALDVVGAVAGGGAAALDSYLNTGSVNWKSTGAWALGGAIGTSVPGTRWFKRLWP